ncbi:MAG: O-methyltransferase, partial [Rhodobacteraceae bacterium]|nr:O-methyltransferase [Paracoccaceae bacterium]
MAKGRARAVRGAAVGEADWTRVEEWFGSRLIGGDPVMEAIGRANRAAGLPAIDVTPAQGRLLALIVRMSGARRVLEIGTLGGYSTAWMARALPAGGRLVTLEADPHHAATARANLARAGLAHLVELREGRAAETLPGLVALAPFDLVFIDADKPSNPVYVDWALRLARPGTVIVLDNVVRDGRILQEGDGDPAIPGTRRAVEALGAAAGRVEATVVQTVGPKGWD